MLGGVCCLLVLLLLLSNRRTKRTNRGSLSSPSPPTDTDVATPSHSAGYGSGSPASSHEQRLGRTVSPQWQPHELEAGQAVSAVNVDAQRRLGSNSVSSTGLSERSIYHTASGMVFVHD